MPRAQQKRFSGDGGGSLNFATHLSVPPHECGRSKRLRRLYENFERRSHSMFPFRDIHHLEEVLSGFCSVVCGTVSSGSCHGEKGELCCVLYVSPNE